MVCPRHDRERHLLSPETNTRIASGAIHFSICFGWGCLNVEPVALMSNAVIAEETQEVSKRFEAEQGPCSVARHL